MEVAHTFVTRVAESAESIAPAVTRAEASDSIHGLSTMHSDGGNVQNLQPPTHKTFVVADSMTDRRVDADARHTLEENSEDATSEGTKTALKVGVWDCVHKMTSYLAKMGTVVVSLGP